MRIRQRAAAGVASGVLALAFLAGCAADDWSAPHAAPTPIGALGAGFEPSASPSPEATIDPTPGSWSGVHPSPGYRVVLLTAGTGTPTRRVTDSVRSWAADEKVSLRVIAAGGDHVKGVADAIALKPDLIVAAGNDLVDALALVSASHLDQPFLVLGAEVGEPTYNVTAVGWSGASFRGTGNNASSVYDPESFTSARTDAAIRAGTASVLHGLTGIVIWLD